MRWRQLLSSHHLPSIIARPGSVTWTVSPVVLLRSPAPHRAALERKDPRIGVPRGGNRRRLVERRRVVEPGQHVFERVGHWFLYRGPVPDFKAVA